MPLQNLVGADLLDPSDEEDVAQVREALAVEETKPNRSAGFVLGLLVVSLLLFWGGEQSSGGQTFGWIATLVLVIAVHEGGHYLAMRAFGYTDLKVFFIPFLGAAASGRKIDASATQRAIVSLMGPMPGILAALIAGLALAPLTQPWVRELLWLALIVNAFNLLPIMPLDGGRFLDATLFARWPVMRQVVGHLSGLAMVGLGWALDSWILIGVGVFTFVVAGASRIVSEVGAELRSRFDPARRLPPTIPDALVPHAMQEANFRVYNSVKGGVTPQRYAKVIANFWAQAGNHPPTVGTTMGLLALYLGCVGLTVAAGMTLVLS